MTDEQRETYIEACGRHFLAAHAAGDMETARHWLAEQGAAVRQRSPAQVARMEQDYFSADAERTRMEALQRMAA